jgi:hypothetical protein
MNLLKIRNNGEGRGAVASRRRREKIIATGGTRDGKEGRG